MSITLATAFLTLGIWVYLLLARGMFWQVRFPDEIAPMPQLWPDICVIIPARNEADALPSSLPSILTDDYPGTMQVLLVDDRSEDATAAIAKRIAEECQATKRLNVIAGRALPTGWKGKVWAMQTGLEAIAMMPQLPRYVLFTDADIAYEKGAITRLVAQSESRGFVLNSLMVRLRCRSVAERFLIPAFVYFFQMLYPFSWVNDASRKIAAAAGGCMLVRYDALMLAGGMMPLRSALIDDCALGRQMKRQGPIHLALTQHVHSIRAYPALSDIRAMVTRSAYDQLGYSPLLLVFAILGMALTYASPVALTCLASGISQVFGALAWACMTLSFSSITRFYNRPALSGVALPVIAVAYMYFTLDSAYQYMRGRGGVWKGRIQACGVQSA